VFYAGVDAMGVSVVQYERLFFVGGPFPFDHAIVIVENPPEVN
jgi:hypothetical protein